MRSLADVYNSQGKYAQAEALHGQTIEIKRRVLGPDHPDTLLAMRDLACVYVHQGKYALGEALLSKTLQISRRVLGPEHPATLHTVSNLVYPCLAQGKYALAETYAAQALAGRQGAFGPGHPATIDSVDDLALVYESEGEFADSEPLAREDLEFNHEKQPDEWQRFRAESLLGASSPGQKKYAEAEPLLLEGFRGMVARKDRIAVRDWFYLDRAQEWRVQTLSGVG